MKGNFGIVTSAVIKAYDPISITTTEFNFQTSPVQGNPSNNIQVSYENFWKGIDAYFAQLVRINDAKGTAWNYIYTQAPTTWNPQRTFSFVGQINLNDVSASEAKKFAEPLFEELNAIGINLKNPEPAFYETFPDQAFRPNGPGEGVGNGRFGSRLFPRSNFEDPESEEFAKTMKSIRSFVEDGGYTFHSVDYHPSHETAGYPGRNSAVNPHLRTAIMHATGFDTASYGPETTPQQRIASHARLNEYVQKWRDASPGSGAYMNEADTAEPNFQESMYGNNYARLLEIKKEIDPWGVFYAVTAVGSDAWKVEANSGMPTQQGRLCRI